MNRQQRVIPCFRSAAVGLAVALLFGCGGGGDSNSTLTEQPLAVQVSETATILSVKADLPSKSMKSEFEAQAMAFTFAAQIDSGPNAGLALNGRLELKGEREDEGLTEVEGRLFPDATPSLASREDLKAEFNAKRKALKGALRADIKALSQQLKVALSSGAVPGSDEPSAAQKEALAAFKAAFEQRMTEYRLAMSALIAEYRAAKRDGERGGDDDDNDAKGYEVHGTIDGNGVVNLTVSLGDKGKIVATGTIAADGRAKGNLTGPASNDRGTWTASETDMLVPSAPVPPAPVPPAPVPPAPVPPPPPPAPPPPAPPPPPPTCTTTQPAAQVRTQACPTGTTGSWTQTNVYVAAPAPTCWTPSAWLPATAPTSACVPVPPPPPPPPAPSPPGPSAANGKVLYNAIPGSALSCASCHTANPAQNVSKVLNGANDPNRIATAISRGTGGMGALSGKLTQAQLEDIAAYLAQPNL